MFADLKEIHADLWVFDNDGTLYTNQNIQSAVESLMVSFIEKEYGIDACSAVQCRQRLLRKHHTKYTAIALRNEGVDVVRFIQATYLSVNPKDFGLQRYQALYDVISSLSGEKIVLTNNPSGFARRILCALGIHNLFSNVSGMEEIGFVLKPARKAFAVLEKPLRLGKSVVVVENSPDNLRVAKDMDCLTVLIGNKYSKDLVPDIHLISLTQGGIK